MIIRLWNFTKRHNSTARPSGGGSVDVEVVFKRLTSINNPTFQIMWDGIPTYNYVEVPSLHMFYYVEDIQIGVNNIFELVCKIDVLATARPYILNSSSFVKYSSSNYDEYLKDDRIQPTASLESLVKNNNFASLFNTHPEYTSSYSLLLTVLNGDANNNTAGIKHYLIINQI